MVKVNCHELLDYFFFFLGLGSGKALQVSRTSAAR